MSTLLFFWIVLTLISLGAFVHPFFTYPLSLWIVRIFSNPHPQTEDCPPVPLTFSIVFCAYNEEKVVSAKLENMKEIQNRYGADKVRILAYDDCSSDRTLEILRQYEPDVQVFRGTVRSGKSTGMNILLENSTSDIVIFTDANVALSPEVIPEFTRSFASVEVGVVCGHLIYSNQNTTSRDTPTASIGTAYWKLEEVIKELESKTGSAMGADGSLFAIRRKLFRPVPADIIDDFFTSMSILCDGHRIIRNANAKAFEASADNSSDEYRRKVRIACRVYNCYRMIRPKIRRLDFWNQYKFYSHKWLRWLGALWLTIAMTSFCFAVGTIYHWTSGAASATAITAMIGTVWLLSRIGLSIPAKLWSVWLGYWGTLHGVILSLRGERFQTWSPVASSRKIVVRQP